MQGGILLIVMKCLSSLDAQTNQLIPLHAYKDPLHRQEAQNVKTVLLAHTVHLTALKHMCLVLQVHMLMRHHYLSVWNVQQVTFVKIQQNLLSFVKMEHTVKGILPIALCALQDSGTDYVLPKAGNSFHNSQQARAAASWQGLGIFFDCYRLDCQLLRLSKQEIMKNSFPQECSMLNESVSI